MKKSMCLFLLLLLLTSCGNKEDASPSPQDNQTASEQFEGNVQTRQAADAGSIPPEVAGEAADPQSDIELKDHLEALAERVPGVNGAHCVVLGNTAVVGIDVEGSLTRSRVGSVKYSVAEALRKDQGGLNTFVTADIDMSARLAELSRHASEGRPISGIASELADIIGRIIPQLPEDTRPAGEGQKP